MEFKRKGIREFGVLNGFELISVCMRKLVTRVYETSDIRKLM